MKNIPISPIFQGGVGLVPVPLPFRRFARLLLLVFAIGANCCCATAADSGDSELDDVIQSAQQWARENLDDEVLQALEGMDGEKVRRLLTQLNKEFRGESVLDLARLRQGAREILPILEGFEETLPYAVWLQTRLDYLEVAEELCSKVLPPKSPHDETAVPNPAPALQREIWIEKMVRQPWPKNSEKYVKQLKPVFRASAVPGELVWVAEVESSFDPRARSPEGATGLFQLMPATAKRFGLSTWPIDHRMRPEPSARAAAQYLRFLYGKFKDWRLALAAYNCGEGRVEGLLKKHEGTSYDSIARHLPAETQMYVPKVESVLLRRESVRLAELKLPPAAPGSK